MILGGCHTIDGRQVMLDEALLYRIADDRYDRLDRLPYAAVTLGAALHRGRLFVCGGEDKPRHRVARAAIGRLHFHERERRIEDQDLRP